MAEPVEAPDIDRVINSIRALFPFGQQHVDRLRDRIEVDALWFWSTDARPCVPTFYLRPATLVGEAVQSDDIWWRSEKDLYVQKR